MDATQAAQMQAALEEMRQQVVRLTGENESLRAAHMGMKEMASSLGELAKSLGKRDRDKDRRLLVDTKGLGKPDTFNNDETGFRRWSRTICNLTVGVFGKEFQDVLDHCLDLEDAVDFDILEQKFEYDELTNDQGIRDIADKCDQLYRVLSSLTTGESEDLVVGCANLKASGFEAWRRLNRRWDPVTAGRKRNILRAILNPERTKTWDGVRPAIEQLDDLIRRYEARKNENGLRETLSDDIKCTAIELLVPQDLEKHLILNKSRLTSYALIKQEIEVLMETMMGSKSKIHRPGSAAASSSQGPAPMEVDSLAQWLGSLVKGKGKGSKGSSKGNKGGKTSDKDITCYNCGKTGHRAADCWSKKKEGSSKGSSKGSNKGSSKGSSKGTNKGSSKGSSKGPQGKGKGKKSASAFEEAEEEEYAPGEEPENEDVGTFDINGINLNSEPQECGVWTKFNLDTGAAQTAIPSDWDFITRKPGKQITFKTASGELVPSEGDGSYIGTDANGMRCRITGPVANVHKPLVSAHKCLNKGRIAILDEHGGYVLLPVKSAVGRDIQRTLRKASYNEQKKWLRLYQEKGVYNFYLNGPDTSPNSGFGRQPKDA